MCVDNKYIFYIKHTDHWVRIQDITKIKFHSLNFRIDEEVFDDPSVVLHATVHTPRVGYAFHAYVKVSYIHQNSFYLDIII